MRPQDGDGRERTRARVGEHRELLDLLHAHPGEGHAVHPEHDVAVGERGQGAALNPHAERGAEAVAPDARGRLRLQREIVDRQLLLERSPGAVGVELRHVGPQLGRRDHPAPGVGREHRRRPRARRLRVRGDGLAVNGAQEACLAAELARQLVGAAGDRAVLEGRRRRHLPRLAQVGAPPLLPTLALAAIELGAKLVRPGDHLDADGARHGAGPRARRRLQLRQEPLAVPTQQRPDRGVRCNGPQSVRVEPVAGGRGKLCGVDRRHRAGQRGSRLLNDRSGVVAGEPRRVSGGHRQAPVQGVHVVGGGVGILVPGVA